MADFCHHGVLLQGAARGWGLRHLHGPRQARERGPHQVWIAGGYLVSCLVCALLLRMVVVCFFGDVL